MAQSVTMCYLVQLLLPEVWYGVHVVSLPLTPHHMLLSH